MRLLSHQLSHKLKPVGKWDNQCQAIYQHYPNWQQRCIKRKYLDEEVGHYSKNGSNKHYNNYIKTTENDVLEAKLSLNFSKKAMK